MLLLLLMSAVAGSGATYFEDDGIRYVLNADGTSVSVASKSGGYSGEVTIPASVTYSSKEYAVTTIGSMAFYNGSALTNVILPPSVVKIEGSAFYQCTSLTSVNLSTIKEIGEYAFYGCTSLATISLGEELTSIGNYAFQSCPITTLDIPASVETIGNSAFYNRNGLLTSLTLHEGLKSIGSYAFSSDYSNYNCQPITISLLTLPNSIVSIGNGAFKGWASIQELTLPTSLETIGELAFQNCVALNTVTFGNKVKSVGTGAFKGCSNIIRVEIGDLTNWCNIEFGDDDSGQSPANPLEIAKKVYLNNMQLDELTIPSSVTKIGNFAFKNVQKFDKLTIPASVTEIGDYTFDGCSDMEQVVFQSQTSLNTIGNGAFRKCTGLTTITLPSSVTTFGTGIFRECSNLTTVNIPEGIVDLPSYTFYNCAKLGSISLPENLKFIGSWSFLGCTGLTRIDIPASVEIIGTEAFKDCTGLTGVYITDLAKWCAIEFGNYQYQGSNWQTEDKQSNPLIFAKKLYLNNELVEDMVIPDGVETIQPYAFWGAECITSLTIPATVTTINNNAFWYCINLRSITIPSSVTTIGLRAFGFLCQKNSHNKDHVKVYIDDIGCWLNNNYGKAFYEVGQSIYKGCNVYVDLYCNGDRITNLTIPSSVTALGEYALASIDVSSVTLHSGIERLDFNCFYWNPMKRLYSKSKFAPEIYYGSATRTSFNMAINLNAIYVPSGKGTAYKNKWSEHEAIIKEADMTIKGEQSSATIAEAKAAYTAVVGEAPTYVDLSEATLDESVTFETLKAGDESGNVLYYLPSSSTITGSNIIIDGVAANITLTAGEDLNIPVDFVADEVTYPRTIASDANAYTVCLPYDYALPSGMKAYTFSSNDSEGNLVFTEASAIEANKPYLVTASSTVSDLNVQNVTMKATPATMPDAGLSVLEFRGTLKKIDNATAAGMGAYILQANKEWHPVSTTSAGAYIAAGRAYIVPKASESRLCINTVLDTNDVTGIKLVSKEGAEEFYDLQGRRVDKPAKGIFIVGGKKYVYGNK